MSEDDFLRFFFLAQHHFILVFLPEKKRKERKWFIVGGKLILGSVFQTSFSVISRWHVALLRQFWIIPKIMQVCVTLCCFRSTLMEGLALLQSSKQTSQSDLTYSTHLTQEALVCLCKSDPSWPGKWEHVPRSLPNASALANRLVL